MKTHATPFLVILGCAILGAGFVMAQSATQEEQLIIPLVPLAPGGGAPVWEKSPNAEKFAGDAEAIAAGKQLFMAMNCVGCHANGGGGMGPPLMDNVWIYGGAPGQIFSTIREGRPNGMPSFRGALPDEQIWQVAAFVRSLSEGNAPPGDSTP